MWFLGVFHSLYGGTGFNIKIDILNDIVFAGGTGSDSLNLEMPNKGDVRFEPSSCNIIAIAGLHASLLELNVDEIYRHEKRLTNLLVDELRNIKRVTMYLPPMAYWNYIVIYQRNVIGRCGNYFG